MRRSASASAPGPKPCVACKLLGLGDGQGAGLVPGGRSAVPLGGSGTATLRPGCATHSTLSPRPAARESSLALAEDPSLQFLGIGCYLQLCFPGAGAKQAPPQPLEGLQAFCVEHFSAAAGRPTSWGLEETQQPASVCFAPAVKRGAWLVLPDPHTGLAAPRPVGQARTPLHQCPASCPQGGNLHRAFNF